MRKIKYQKKQSLKRRRKVIAINEHSEDKECRTNVRKSFVYKLTRVNHISKTNSKPEIFIRKNFNTKLQQEKFAFRVKGAFYMTRDEHILRVDFCHTLRIAIHWKNKAFSPKKSVTLT